MGDRVFPGSCRKQNYLHNVHIVFTVYGRTCLGYVRTPCSLIHEGLERILISTDWPPQRLHFLNSAVLRLPGLCALRLLPALLLEEDAGQDPGPPEGAVHVFEGPRSLLFFFPVVTEGFGLNT